MPENQRSEIKLWWAAAEEAAVAGKRATGSAADATIGTTLSDPSAIAASSHGSSSTTKPQLIPSGFLGLAIGSAPVCFFCHFDGASSIGNLIRDFFFLLKMTGGIEMCNESFVAYCP